MLMSRNKPSKAFRGWGGQDRKGGERDVTREQRIFMDSHYISWKKNMATVHQTPFSWNVQLTVE